MERVWVSVVVAVGFQWGMYTKSFENDVAHRGASIGGRYGGYFTCACGLSTFCVLLIYLGVCQEKNGTKSLRKGDVGGVFVDIERRVGIVHVGDDIALYRVVGEGDTVDEVLVADKTFGELVTELSDGAIKNYRKILGYSQK